jgi:hypothetical protein
MARMDLPKSYLHLLAPFSIINDSLRVGF